MFEVYKYSALKVLITLSVFIFYCNKIDAQSQSFYEQTLKIDAIESNKKCPFYAGAEKVIKIEYKSHTYYFYFEISEYLQDIDDLNSKKQLAKELVEVRVQRALTDSSNKNLLEKISKAGASFCNVFVGEESKKECYITLSNHDIKKILQKPKQSKDDLDLQFQVISFNIGLPFKYSKGMQCCKYYLRNNTITLGFCIDESYFSIEKIKPVKDELIKNMINNTDKITVSYIIGICNRFNKKIHIELMGDKTGNKIDYYFDNNDIKRLMEE